MASNCIWGVQIGYYKKFLPKELEQATQGSEGVAIPGGI